MNKLMVVPETIKDIMENKNISLEELSKESKISKKFLKDILNGERAAPEYLFKVLESKYGIGYKFLLNLQNKELYENKFEVGERGKIL